MGKGLAFRHSHLKKKKNTKIECVGGNIVKLTG